MPPIDSIEACSVVIPLDAPTSFARRTVRHRHYTLVRVRAETVEGLGFCYAGSLGGSIVTDAVRQLVAPLAIGQDSHRVRGIWEDLYQELLLHGRAGSVMRAISAFDIAVWDLNARLARLPLWKYLGAVADESVAAYASGGYYAEGKTPRDLAGEMNSYVQLGFRAVKLKVGRAAPDEDEIRVAAVRDAVGPDVLVMLDANNAWRDLPTALDAIGRLEKYRPYWIEEPFGPDDISNHARLAAATPISVATGEIEAGRWRHMQLLTERAATVLQTDAAVCGGITEFQRIAAAADSFGVTISPHWFHDLHVHLVASTPNARFVEFFPDDKVLNFRRLIDHELQISTDGHLRLPTGPGLGFQFAASAVANYAQGAWA